MSNFSETYFYSSVLDNGKLNEYGCGVKNVNDSKEYYIYDSDSKNYITVDKYTYKNVLISGGTKTQTYSE